MNFKLATVLLLLTTLSVNAMSCIERDELVINFIDKIDDFSECVKLLIMDVNNKCVEYDYGAYFTETRERLRLFAHDV